VWQLLLRRTALLIALIFASVCIGTIGYIVIDDYPADGAFSMAAITVATVGYAEIRPLSHAGCMFNSDTCRRRRHAAFRGVVRSA
jgi:voltage-gated potassium channel